MSYAGEPKAPKPDPSAAPQEPTGPVASDSLAAESNRAGGGFSENENIAQLSVKGGQSTLANTDTSGATVLHAAVDGAAREKQDAKGLGADEKGSAGGLKYPDAEVPEFTGTHSQEGYVGGTSADELRAEGSTVAQSFAGATGDSFADGGAGLGSSSGGDNDVSSSSATSGSASTSKVTSSSGTAASPAPGTGAAPVGASGSIDTADEAPNYAATVSGALRPEGEDQPKGENLTEGGIPETKTFTGNVGGDKDPGRLAEQKFEQINANTASGAGAGKTGDNENPFEVLESERA